MFLGTSVTDLKLKMGERTLPELCIELLLLSGPLCSPQMMLTLHIEALSTGVPHGCSISCLRLPHPCCWCWAGGVDCYHLQEGSHRHLQSCLQGQQCSGHPNMPSSHGPAVSLCPSLCPMGALPCPLLPEATLHCQLCQGQAGAKPSPSAASTTGVPMEAQSSVGSSLPSSLHPSCVRGRELCTGSSRRALAAVTAPGAPRQSCKGSRV